MIRYLEHLTPQLETELQHFCEDSVFGVKALGPVLSYGLGYDFISAYVQRDGEGRLTAFLSKCYGTVVFHCVTEGNLPELIEFLHIIGFGALVGPASVLSEAFPDGEIGCVMELPDGCACIAKKTEKENVELVFDKDYKQFYEVLTRANPGYVVENYGDFLTDFSHRVRHGTAHSVLLYEGGNPVSTAAALVVTEHAVFLGAIATAPEARGNRFAATCIRALCDQFPERQIYLMCKPEKQAFYEHLGFSKMNEYLETASSRK